MVGTGSDVAGNVQQQLDPPPSVQLTQGLGPQVDSVATVGIVQPGVEQNRSWTTAAIDDSGNHRSLAAGLNPLGRIENHELDTLMGFRGWHIQTEGQAADDE